MTFLYEYMNSDELAFARESAQLANESLKLEHAFNIAEMRHEIRLSDIEVDSFVNEYTEDDLTAMYVQEMSVYMEETGGLWQKFKEFIKKIVDRLRGSSKQLKEIGPADQDVKVKMPIDFGAMKNFVAGIGSSLKKIAIPKDQEGNIDKEGVVKNALLTAGLSVAFGGVAALRAEFKKMRKPVTLSLADAERALDVYVGEVVSVQSIPSLMEKWAGEIGAAIAAKAREFVNGFISALQRIGLLFMNILKTIKSKVMKGEVDKSENSIEVKSDDIGDCEIVWYVGPDAQKRINAAKKNLPEVEDYPVEDEDDEKKNDDNSEKDKGGNSGNGKEKLSEVLNKTGSGEQIDMLKAYANAHKSDLGIDANTNKKDIVIDYNMMAKIRNHIKKNDPERAEKLKKTMAYLAQNKDNINYNEATRFDPFLGVDVFYEYNYHSMDYVGSDYVGESSLDINDFLNPFPRADLSELCKLVELL